jgi:hypothetical protein
MPGTYYYQTPSPMSALSVYMLDRFDMRQTIGVQTAWQAFWQNAPPKYGRDSASLSIDIIRGSRKMAALVQRGSREGESIDEKQNDSGKFTSITRLWPLLEEKASILASDLLQRQAGELPTDMVSQYDRLRNKAQDIYTETTKKIITRNEFTAAYSVINGKQLYWDGNTTDVIDYLRSSDNTFACEDEWDDTEGNPFTDLNAACVQAVETGRVAPKMVVFSP